MTPEEQQELTNMAIKYDNLSPELKRIFVSQIGYIPSVKMECEITKEGYLRVPETIQNTSNASSHIDVLEEESKEMVEVSKDGLIENNVKTFVYNGEVKIETISDKAW